MYATSSAFIAVIRQQASSSESACGPVRGMGDVAGWLLCQVDVNSSLLIAVGTIGLFFVGLVGIGIRLVKLRRDDSDADERPATVEHSDRAAARIANLAFPVRRTLAKSLDRGWLLDDQLINRRDRAREIQRGFVDHEPRIEDILDEANRASPEIADAARRAAQLFWEAADGVNDMAAFEPQHFGDKPSDDVLAGFREARSATEDCVEILRRLDAPVREAGGE